MAGRPALPSSSQGLDTLNDYVKRARTIPQPSHSAPPPSRATPPPRPRWIVQSTSSHRGPTHAGGRWVVGARLPQQGSSASVENVDEREDSDVDNMLQMTLRKRYKRRVEFNSWQIYLAIPFYDIRIYDLVYHTDVFSDDNNEDDAADSNLDKTLDIPMSPLTELDELGLCF